MMIFGNYHVLEPMTGYPFTAINADGTPATTELDMMHGVKAQSQPIGEFLAWLNDQGIVLAKYEGEAVWPRPIYTSIEDLLAEHFEIDLKKVEQERRALQDYFRARNASTSDSGE
jgi:hypothetical protein